MWLYWPWHMNTSFLHYVTVDSYHSGCLEYWPWRIWTQDCDTWIPVSCTVWLLTAIIQVAWNIGREGYDTGLWHMNTSFLHCDCWQLSFRLPGILAMRDIAQDCDMWMLSQFPALCDWLPGILSRLFVIVQQFPRAARTTTPPPSPLPPQPNQQMQHYHSDC